MNRSCIIASSLAVAVFAAFAQDAATTISANATLKDGSTVKGEFLTEDFSGSTLFAEKLSIAPSIVKSIAFTGTNGESKVELKNGDKFAMTVANESFKIKSMLGDLNIPSASIRSLAISARRGASDAGNGEDGLLFHCTFDSLEDAGCGQLTGKVKVCNATLADGKSGSALRVQRGLPALELTLPPGTFSGKGCIEFWAKFLDGKTEFSTGGDPRFFTLYKDFGEEFGVFEYASNSGNGTKGLCSRLPIGFTSTHSGYSGMMPYSDIFHGKPYEDWHHYALVWNEQGIESMSSPSGTKQTTAILLDGKNIGRINTPQNPNAMTSFLNATIVIGIPMNRNGPSFNNKSSYLMDDLKMWNYDKTDFDL